MPEGWLRIGEFSRQVGVSADLLRVWERRYGVPSPRRTRNGVRLYSRSDEALVGAMRRALASGVPAAEAARLATDPPSPPSHVALPAGELDVLLGRLRDALVRFDDARAQEQLDRLFGAYSVDAALSGVVLPYLRDLGDRWECGAAGVGEEHFASNLIHGRLLSLARKWDEGHGPRALLACPTGELHTIGLLCFGLALRAHGWRVTYLGADTPTEAVARVAASVQPAQVVLAAVTTGVLGRSRAGLTQLATGTALAIGGADADPALVAELGATPLAADPVTAAAELAGALAAA
jgi:MerR family transcriptional regulator, light-induced transcriptional regulator